MFDNAGEEWFSLFKRAVELLADMSTFQFSATAPAMGSNKQFPQPLQTGNVKGKVPYKRNILVKKAKAAAFQLGKASHDKMGMVSHNKWAGRPTAKGHGVPESILHLGGNMVQTFFPHRFKEQWELQAKAAFD